jgi:hypothetical protein
MDFPIRDYDRAAWDRQVDSGNEWTVPASPEVIAAAQRGEWQVVLTRPSRWVAGVHPEDPSSGSVPFRR